MDWANERYVRLYVRETDDDLVLSWQALALWRAMLIKFDRAGILQSKRGAAGLAAQVRMPLEAVTPALAELIRDGRVVAVSNGFAAPNFMQAQETGQSNRQRQFELRERRRARALSPSQGITDRNGESQGVTDCHSSLARLADPSDPGVSGVTDRNEAPSITNRADRRLVFSRFAPNPRFLEVSKRGGEVLGLVEQLDDGTLREATLEEALA